MYATLPFLWRYSVWCSNHTICDAALTTLFAELLLWRIYFRDYACPEGCRWGILMERLQSCVLPKMRDMERTSPRRIYEDTVSDA
jgi:hypothetical protein